MSESPETGYKKADDDAIVATVATPVPQAEPVRMVTVMAPATLPAGYKFEAQIGERKFMATVPEGGVKEGETFQSPLPPEGSDRGINAPEGHWKDGLFDCCVNGFFHPHLWCSLCCTQVHMGQVMQRMSLTWLGLKGPQEQTRNTFKVVLVIVIAYTIYSTCLDYIYPDYMYGEAQEMPTGARLMKQIGGFLWTIWSVFALMKTRKNTREKYNIAEQRCNGCEDLCCACWCPCCTVAQISRHTGEYETYRATCFTDTGLPSHAPAVV